jgi:hypothetical protein
VSNKAAGKSLSLCMAILVGKYSNSQRDGNHFGLNRSRLTGWTECFSGVNLPSAVMDYLTVYFPSDNTYVVIRRNNKAIKTIVNNEITVDYGTDVYQGKIVGTSSKLNNLISVYF